MRDLESCVQNWHTLWIITRFHQFKMDNSLDETSQMVNILISYSYFHASVGILSLKLEIKIRNDWPDKFHRVGHDIDNIPSS